MNPAEQHKKEFIEALESFTAYKMVGEIDITPDEIDVWLTPKPDEFTVEFYMGKIDEINNCIIVEMVEHERFISEITAEDTDKYDSLDLDISMLISNFLCQIDKKRSAKND